MRLGSKAVLIGVTVVVIGGAVTAMAMIAMGVLETDHEPSCFDRLSPGPNSNTSRLDTTLDIPRSEWPAVAQVLHEFAAGRHWSVREAIGSTDPNYRWLEMCDDAVTTIRAGNMDGEGEKIGFGIIHMEYDGAGNDGWQVFYRDLHARFEARWAGRMHYVEGELGQTISRPEWLGPTEE